MMAHLAAALPASMQAAHAASSQELIAPLTEVLRDGDIVLIKGSNGSQMARVVEALKALAAT
jgi:UDP-N-acetylmuramoyl-tripeptide--D-alanyl-D-alanine ligase